MPSWLLSLVGADGAGPLGKIVDKALAFIPDPAQREKFLADMRAMDWTEMKAQIDINAIEAQSEKWWKAGWRPAFGWTCAAAFAYHYILANLILTIVFLFNPEWAGAAHMPQVDWTELSPVALGLLGLSRDRRIEKQEIIKAKG